MKIITNYHQIIQKKMRRADIKVYNFHYTGMQSEIESIKRLKNPKSKVSVTI